MSIATEKVKFATERFLLVRLNPARFIEPTLNVSVYEMTFPFIPNRIERNGVALTEDNSTPSVNDHWYYDPATQLLQVKLASAPNDTTNVLVAYYYLFYTGTIFRSISEDPEDALTPIREWEPRIDNYPSFLQSFANILAGVFSISDTTISIINEDGGFQNYLTDDDSFYNKMVDIWLCIADESNIQKVFTGTIQSLSFTANKVSIKCTDSFNTLSQPALMGDTADEAYLRRTLSSYPSLDPQGQDKPLPYICGSSSRFQTNTYSVGLVGAPDVFRIVVATQAFCIDFDPDITTAKNRTWITCRTENGVSTQAFGALQAYLAATADYHFARFASLSNVQVGDTIKWNQGGTDYYGYVHYVGSFTYSSVNYNLVFSFVSVGASFTLASVVANLTSFNLFLKLASGEIVYPAYDRDYSVITQVTSGGNQAIEVEFENNFETNFTAMSGLPLNPQTNQLYFRASNNVVDTHASILTKILGIVGLPVEPTSFAQADVDLPVNVRFHIPNFDETDYKPYLKYVQDVLASTLGYLRINSDFEVQYNILAAPSSSNRRDTSLILQGSMTAAMEYADITTQLIAYNPHNDSQLAIDDANSPSETRDNQRARYLHGLVNADRFRHVLEEITSNIDRHIALKSSRRVKYKIKTATQDIDTELGDDLELVNKVIMGGTGMADVKVISIEKSPSSVSIEASDLKGL